MGKLCCWCENEASSLLIIRAGTRQVCACCAAEWFDVMTNRPIEGSDDGSDSR
jgi:hypothetical protein